SHEQADVHGTPHEMTDFHGASHLHAANPMESAAGDAAALGAIRRAAKDARLNARRQIRGIVGGHLGEEAIVRVAGRMDESSRDSVVNVQFREFSLQQRQPFGYELAVLRRQDRKSTRLNSSHRTISYAVFCLKKK